MKAISILAIATSMLIVAPNRTEAQIFKVKTHKMTVAGSSSLHDWESVVEKVDVRASFVVNNQKLDEIKDVVVKVPVTSIKSSKGKMMDSKTHDAFGYQKNPEIVFTMSAGEINQTASSASLKGTLLMAGAKRPVEITVRYKVLPNGDLQFAGSKKLIMTDYKMDPPTAMMGTVRVGEEVTVSFDLVLTNAAEISSRQ